MKKMAGAGLMPAQPPAISRPQSSSGEEELLYGLSGGALEAVCATSARVVRPHVVARGATCDRRPAASTTTGPNDDDVEAAAGTRRRGGALQEILLDHKLGYHR